MNVTPAFLWFYYFSYIFLQTKSLVIGFPRLLVLLARPLEILMTALMSHINNNNNNIDSYIAHFYPQCALHYESRLKIITFLLLTVIISYLK